MELAAAKTDREENTLTAFLISKWIPRHELDNVGIILLVGRCNIKAACLHTSNLIPTLIAVTQFVNNIAVFCFSLTVTIPVIKDFGSSRGCVTLLTYVSGKLFKLVKSHEITDFVYCIRINIFNWRRIENDIWIIKLCKLLL